MTLLAPTRAPASARPRDVVTLRLGDALLAIPAQLLREVLEPVPVTRVPQAPEFVRGLVNVRGAVVPLADLRVAFGMPRRPLGPDGRFLVLDLALAGRTSVVAILADAVHEVTRLDPAALQEVPPLGTRWPPRFVEAVGRRDGELLVLPDLGAVFSAFLEGRPGPSPTPPSGPMVH